MAAPPSEDDHLRGPLDGVLVADFSRILAGPYATMLLADLGAEVVKVEGPAGDDTRTWMPPVRDGVSSYYLGINRNKRSIALDLEDPDDLRLAQELAARADVLIENLRPGGMARFGLDHATVSAGNPGIVYASISGFGTTEEGAKLAGYDLMVQGIAGLMSLTGEPDGPPYRAGISVFDVIAGLHAAIGVVAALRHRDQHGRGQRVEVDLLSSALSGLVNHTSAAVASEATPYRMGNAHPSLFPYEPLATADGEIIVIAGNDRQFRALCEVLDIPEVADDERFATNEDRTARRDELTPLLLEALARDTSDHWFARLRERGLPGGPVNTVREGVAFARQIGLEPVVEVGEDGERIPSIRNPITFSETPATYRHAPPRLDQHRAELEAWLSAPRD
jgi:crotonobetainyl-CoA:carnitine CoA-transferase CaiB-like acyl-CoA transferase